MNENKLTAEDKLAITIRFGLTGHGKLGYSAHKRWLRESFDLGFLIRYGYACETGVGLVISSVDNEDYYYSSKMYSTCLIENLYEHYYIDGHTVNGQ